MPGNDLINQRKAALMALSLMKKQNPYLYGHDIKQAMQAVRAAGSEPGIFKIMNGLASVIKVHQAQWVYELNICTLPVMYKAALQFLVANGQHATHATNLFQHALNRPAYFLKPAMTFTPHAQRDIARFANLQVDLATARCAKLGIGMPGQIINGMKALQNGDVLVHTQAGHWHVFQKQEKGYVKVDALVSDTYNLHYHQAHLVELSQNCLATVVYPNFIELWMRDDQHKYHPLCRVQLTGGYGNLTQIDPMSVALAADGTLEVQADKGVYRLAFPNLAVVLAEQEQRLIANESKEIDQTMAIQAPT